MAIQANDIRKGMVILFEGTPVKVMEFRHHTPGNLRAMVQTRLRNLLTGNSFEHRFRSADTLEVVRLDQQKMEYLYSDGTHHHFMNTESYEQYELTKEQVGDVWQFLKDGIECTLMVYNNNPLAVTPPNHVILRVDYAEPAARGNTATNVQKPVKIETGAEIMAPAFVNTGDYLRIDTRTGEYIERSRAPEE